MGGDSLSAMAMRLIAGRSMVCGVLGFGAYVV
ncbi:hypothetical protein [Mycobacterium avium]|nr:hypothetical protein [Mycobacterium avium]